jgi:GTP-binding protein HflX
MGDLVAKIAHELARLKVEVVLDLPFDRGDLVARVHSEGEVVEQSHTAAGTHLVARINRGALGELAPYVSSMSE